MTKNVGLIVGLAAVAVVGTIVVTNMDDKKAMSGDQAAVGDSMVKDTMVKDEMAKDAMVKDEMVKDTMVKDAMVKDEMVKDAMVKDTMVKDAMEQPKVMTGSYEAYAPEKIARAADGDVVLFFHASWCPSCRSLNSSIEKGAASIPKGLTILKADYDTETEMKKKYGVTTQHTLVQVDKDGTLVKKWSGSPDLAALVAQVK